MFDFGGIDKISEAEILERIDDIRTKMRKATETGYGNMQVMTSLKEWEKILLEEFNARQLLNANPNDEMMDWQDPHTGEIIKVPGINIGGVDDTGMKRKEEQKRKREMERENEKKRRW